MEVTGVDKISGSLYNVTVLVKNQSEYSDGRPVGFDFKVQIQLYDSWSVAQYSPVYQELSFSGDEERLVTLLVDVYNLTGDVGVRGVLINPEDGSVLDMTDILWFSVAIPAPLPGGNCSWVITVYDEPLPGTLNLYIQGSDGVFYGGLTCLQLDYGTYSYNVSTKQLTQISSGGSSVMLTCTGFPSGVSQWIPWMQYEGSLDWNWGSWAAVGGYTYVYPLREKIASCFNQCVSLLNSNTPLNIQTNFVHLGQSVKEDLWGYQWVTPNTVNWSQIPSADVVFSCWESGPLNIGYAGLTWSTSPYFISLPVCGDNIWWVWDRHRDWLHMNNMIMHEFEHVFQWYCQGEGIPYLHTEHDRGYSGPTIAQWIENYTIYVTPEWWEILTGNS